MQILFITPYVPSPIRVRPYELLRALIAQGVRPTLLCPGNASDTEAIKELQSWGLTVHVVPITMNDRVRATARGALRGLPLQAAYGIPSPFVSRLRELLALERFDLVHIEHLRAIGLLPFFGDLPVVYDAVDCISLLLERTSAAGPNLRSRLIAAVEHRRTQAFERKACRAAGAITVTSPEDAAALHALAPRAAIHVVPNGVDLERFKPPEWQRAQNVVILTGKMSYHANVAAAQRLIEGIMPHVWRQRPATQVWLVGSSPPRSLQRYAADPRVVVTGRVSDVALYLRQATIAVSPLRYGVGVQNKVLEAMATATPVVGDQQCLASLQVQPNRHLFVARDDDAFAAKIVQLLDNPRLQVQMGKNGRTYVEQVHQWSWSASRLIRVYHHLLQAQFTPSHSIIFNPLKVVQ